MLCSSLQEREESVSCLLGEVEALRAKKSVVEKFLQEKTVTSEQQHISEHKFVRNGYMIIVVV